MSYQQYSTQDGQEYPINSTNNHYQQQNIQRHSDKAPLIPQSKYNLKYMSPDKNEQRQSENSDQFQKIPKSYSQKRMATQPDQPNGNRQDDFSTQTQLKTYNDGPRDFRDLSQERIRQQMRMKNQAKPNLVLKGSDMQQYINSQIQKKLSYCLNGSNSKEIYPSKIVSALKSGQISSSNPVTAFNINPQNLLKRNLNSNTETGQERGTNQEATDNYNKGLNKNFGSTSRKRILSLQREKEESDCSSQMNMSSQQSEQMSQQHISAEKTTSQGFRQRGINGQPQYQTQRVNQSMESQKLREILPKQRLQQNNMHEQSQQSMNSAQKQYQEHNKQNNNQNEQESFNERCYSEKRVKTDSSINTDYTTQTCPQHRTRSPQSMISMISSLSNKQRPFSKKIIEKIKQNRSQQQQLSSRSYYATSSTSFTDNSNLTHYNNGLSHNLQVVQQAQRINKYAQYIKQDTYKLNQELRPNKDKVKELVMQILQMYQFLLSLSADKSRIAKIIKDCGATKGRLIEIFFSNPQLAISPTKEEQYYIKYLDTVEKTFSQFKSQDGSNNNFAVQTDNTIDDQSMFTDKTPLSNLQQQQQTEASDLNLVDNLVANCFYDKLYFKILQKDSNGISYVQEYVDLQVIEDLDNLKTMLQICLKFTEDSSPKKKERSRSPPVQVSPPIQSKDNQKAEMDVKINKYEINRSGKLVKMNGKAVNPQQQDIKAFDSRQNQEQKENFNSNNSNKSEQIRIEDNNEVVNNEVQQYLDMLKDCRTDRKGIISEMRDYSQIGSGQLLPSSYIPDAMNTVSDFTTYLDFDVTKYY